MKRHLVRNLSVLGVVLTLCLALVGVGYGHWSETLHIDGFASWSALYIEVHDQMTNDPVGHMYDYNDPQVVGADESCQEGFQGIYRLWKDVGWTDCTELDLDGDGLRETIQFEMHNAYPSYLGKVTFYVENQSTDAWIALDRVDVSYLDGDDSQWDWYSAKEQDPSDPKIWAMGSPWPHPEGYEVMWTNGTWNMPIKIQPGQSTQFGVWAHVLQPEEPNWDTTYTFRVSLHFIGPVEPPPGY